MPPDLVSAVHQKPIESAKLGGGSKGHSDVEHTDTDHANDHSTVKVHKKPPVVEEVTELSSLAKVASDAGANDSDDSREEEEYEAFDTEAPVLTAKQDVTPSTSARPTANKSWVGKVGDAEISAYKVCKHVDRLYWLTFRHQKGNAG